jgi:GNAT superfamily N-acetyltransferase
VSIAIARSSPDEVRTIARRRDVDDAALRLSLAFADQGTVWVARDDSEVIGVVIAHDSEDERYVGDCFVEASFRGQGIGAALLSATFDDTGDRGRSMLVDPGDTASLALALRFRLAPRETLLRVAGAIPREEELAKMAAGDYRFAVDAIDPAAHRYALNELDRQTRGIAREADHRVFWQSGASGSAFFLSGECIGYAYVWPDGRLGPIACTSEAYLVQILAFALVTLQRQYGASWCTAIVPGSNRRIARAALRAGLRIEEMHLLASDGFGNNLSTYVGYHRLLL